LPALAILLLKQLPAPGEVSAVGLELPGGSPTGPVLYRGKILARPPRAGQRSGETVSPEAAKFPGRREFDGNFPKNGPDSDRTIQSDQSLADRIPVLATGENQAS
jgi:hypothetical protein